MGRKLDDYLDKPEDIEKYMEDKLLMMSIEQYHKRRFPNFNGKSVAILRDTEVNNYYSVIYQFDNHWEEIGYDSTNLNDKTNVILVRKGEGTWKEV